MVPAAAEETGLATDGRQSDRQRALPTCGGWRTVALLVLGFAVLAAGIYTWSPPASGRPIMGPSTALWSSICTAERTPRARRGIL